jgi:hypothetical protein
MDRKKMTASVINQIKPKHSLEILATNKLKISGHIMCTAYSLEKDLMVRTDKWLQKRKAAHKMNR